MTDDYRILERTIESGTVKNGSAIQIDVAFSDGSSLSIECPYEKIPRLVQSVMAAASAAEKQQRAMPGERIEVNSPYIATESMTGRSPDGNLFAIRFQTTEGVPLEVAMPRDIAQQTVDRLAAELAKPAPDNRRLS
jgi:hypothetical protein